MNAQAFLASPNMLLDKLDEHTGKGPGLDVGDHSDADILGLGRFVGFLQKVPDIDVSIFSADVEYAGPCQGPVPCCVPFRCAACLKERSSLNTV